MSPEIRFPSFPPKRFELTKHQLRVLGRLVKQQTGISLGSDKKQLLISRLSRRLRALELDGFSEYLELLSTPAGGRELEHLINSVTTNQTGFFREPNHFDFLVDAVLSELTARPGDDNGRMIKAWSAACSSGQEAYSLAMVLSEFRARRPLWDFKLLATDLDTAMLRQASQGKYSADEMSSVPMDLRLRYFSSSGWGTQRLYTVMPHLRQAVTFGRFNLTSQHYPRAMSMDFVFCRNVLIYFAPPEKTAIIDRMAGVLKPGGYLFLGHAESLVSGHGLLKYAAPTVYRKV